jgi:hypothetical protein
LKSARLLAAIVIAMTLITSVIVSSASYLAYAQSLPADIAEVTGIPAGEFGELPLVFGGCPCATGWMDVVYPPGGFTLAVNSGREYLDGEARWHEGYDDVDIRLIQPNGDFVFGVNEESPQIIETVRVLAPVSGTWEMQVNVISIGIQDEGGDGDVAGAVRMVAYEFEQGERWQYREHKVYAQYDPDIVFTKESAGTMRTSIHGLDDESMGRGYLFKVFAKTFIDDGDIKVTWQHSKDGPGTTVPLIQVYDGSYDRSSFSDFPTGNSLALKGGGSLASLAGSPTSGWSEKTTTLSASSINYAASTQNQVTVFVTYADAHSSTDYSLKVKSIEIVGVGTWTFNDPIIDRELSGEPVISEYGTYSATIS